MRIVVCYPHVNGYMAACWRELASRPGVSLTVLGFRAGSKGYPVAFDDRIMAGIDHRLLATDEIDRAKDIADWVCAQRPDVLMISGWAHRAYRRLAYDRRLDGVRRIMVMDNQYKRTLRQWAGKYLLRGYLRRMDYLFVAGERSWQLTRYWGIPESRVRRGAFAVDFERLDGVFRERAIASDGWPRSFLYVGRYEAMKGIDLLLDGYARYRSVTSDPWPLACAGMGSLESRVAAAAGVKNLGFCQPDEIPSLFRRSSVLVMCGRYDAWPLTLVEGCAAGLGIVCSEACGSSVELVRSYHNGLTVPTGDARAIADAMVWMHRHPECLPIFGRNGNALASAYSASRWADRVLAMVGLDVAGPR